MKKLLFLIPLTAFLYGCGEDVKTVKYWEDNRDERKAFMKKCRDGEVDRNSQSCENARIANMGDFSLKDFRPANKGNK